MGKMKEQNEIYVKEVMEHYFSTYGGSLIDTYLREPSRDNIKTAALRVITLKGRHIGLDSRTLRNFLNYERNGKKYKPIEAKDFEQLLYEYAKYERVSKFVRAYDKSPDARTSLVNVEFLAWLIGFEPRPCSYHEQIREEAKIASFEPEEGEHPKQAGLAEAIFKNVGLLETFLHHTLDELVDAYGLDKNEAFIRLRTEVGDDFLLLNLCIAFIQQKLKSQRGKKRQMDWAERNFGAFGLVFFAVGPREKGMESFFSEVHKDLIDFGIDDLLDDDLDDGTEDI
nr:hypothetical protein [Allomuricauda sp.]